ncbi:MAG TPA: dTMP kinase [Burkholderiaceae bacterium]|nr:dTMP kinase [Burkholderiaceae bacterium]
MTTGRFITFEGIDGAGKSTHLSAVVERLRAAGARVVSTREPGGTPLAERVREIFLHESTDVLTEALLAFAARRDHIRTVIAPALAAGDTVVCDRFTDASFAYQGGGGGAAPAQLEQLEAWVQQGLQPDLTLWFDLPADIAAQRRAQARAADRFEQRDLAFFERVRAGYAARAHAAPQRFARIDAALDRDAVGRQIDTALRARGW